ncbi:PA14 domain containing protein [uncultured Caudovirales phage]|uniref:PA14 domain containing protein n=1 Tax=uncultured Caudovirales phage TaxID=2100421 RepID=A0A6J5L7X1_9CAUD|nr:PA14 domain containing protein [uncultured Caudovirales phage]CAB5219370.1 PA14 domain containing protein [uncultured Caudovirales phage]
MNKLRKYAALFGATLAVTLPLMMSSPAMADSTSDYNAKVAAAKAKIAAVQSQLDMAQSQLDALKNSSSNDAQLLAQAQNDVFLAKEALDTAASDYTSKQALYETAFTAQSTAEDDFNAAVDAVGVASDAVDIAYAAYDQANTNTNNAAAEVATAQNNYDTKLITVGGGGQVTAGLKADIYTNINRNGNPPSRSDVAYTYCKTITVTNINKDWGNGNIEGCGGDYVMIHYRGFITYPTTKQVYFYAAADDGFYMTINGQNIINDWSLKGCGGNSAGLFSFTGGQSYAIDAWMYEWTGGACNTLYYQPLNSGQWTVAPASFFTQQAVALTTKDPALKAILDQKTQAYVDAVAAEDAALANYNTEADDYDSAVAVYQNKQEVLQQKQSLLNTADTALASAETTWQADSDTYAEKDAILTGRKNQFSVTFNAIQAKAGEVATYEASLETAKTELAAIPKPTAAPKTTKKVTAAPAKVTKVVARAKFVPNPKQ